MPADILVIKISAFKEQTPKERARMLFKRSKAGMALTDDEVKTVKQFYPFMRG